MVEWTEPIPSILRDLPFYEWLTPDRTGLTPWVLGASGGIFAGAGAYRKRKLTASGALLAALIGAVLYAAGSLVWFAALLAFFSSSTFFSKWKRHKRRLAEQSYEKGSTRDAAQVAANGLLGALFCVADRLFPDPLWLAGFLGVMAAVTADTWATELGGLSKREPRSILTGKRVPAGTSGGISALGTLASAAGALFIGVFGAACLYLVPEPAVPASPFVLAGLAASAFAGGFVGALADSLLGATVQRMYRCTECRRLLERKEHCGRPASLARGIKWMNNDAVNIISSVAGAVVSILLAHLFIGL
ncbi:DUF92 domain-containing protein [Gorillibacterium sp. CAU 1737]|uniref:DUF92 domain-containing protein n=1 Tax=Gorillibacterium sp. CAU 1737 TaxID=3140362 RepID=UPI00325FEC23